MLLWLKRNCQVFFLLEWSFLRCNNKRHTKYEIYCAAKAPTPLLELGGKDVFWTGKQLQTFYTGVIRSPNICDEYLVILVPDWYYSGRTSGSSENAADVSQKVFLWKARSSRVPRTAVRVTVYSYNASLARLPKEFGSQSLRSPMHCLKTLNSQINVIRTL